MDYLQQANMANMANMAMANAAYGGGYDAAGLQGLCGNPYFDRLGISSLDAACTGVPPGATASWAPVVPAQSPTRNFLAGYTLADLRALASRIRKLLPEEMA